MSSTPVASTSAERDARAVNADHGHVRTGDIAIGVIIGRTSEFFDFFVYAIASVIVFPAFLFPFVDPLTGTLYSFAIFALAFVARPFGSIFFTAIDRRYGRGAKLTGALFMLGGSTAAIAFIPSYETLGWVSIAILAFFRLAQGFALGGTWDGLASLLALNVPQEKRGWYAMIPQLGAPIGLIVACALFLYLLTMLGQADFLGWGWRYPFFVAFAINVVALFARLRIVVTPEYTAMFQTRALQPMPIGQTVRAEGRNMVVGTFVPLASHALFHMVTVFPLSWVFLYSEREPNRFLFIAIISAAVGILAVLASGLLADKIGRAALLRYSAIGIAIFSIVGLVLLGMGPVGITIYMVIGFILLGLSFGQSSGAVAAQFNPNYRYTASAITGDLAWLVGAGFAPLVALLLSSNFGLFSAGAYLLSGAICTLVALHMNDDLRFKSKD